MSRLESLLKPVKLDGIARSKTYRRLRDPFWTFSPLALRSRRELLRLRNSQKGEHGHIIGTGPSLNHTDFSKVNDGPTIGLNRIYLGLDRLGFAPDFLICVNLNMLSQSAGDISAFPSQVIASWASRRDFKKIGTSQDIIFARTTADQSFQKNLTETLPVGATVTFSALQLAYWLGWSQVTLLGIDHHYDLEKHERIRNPHETIERNQADTNHFDAKYIPIGQAWQLPDLTASEESYRAARIAYEADNRLVEDGTVDGRLAVFEKSQISYRK